MYNFVRRQDQPYGAITHINSLATLTALQPASLDAGQIFSGKPSGRLIQGYAAPSAYTPTIDPDYIFHEASRDIIVWLMNKSDPLYVFGPVGCGKTSSIKQLAARLNYPVFEVTGHGQLEFADLVGHLARMLPVESLAELFPPYITRKSLKQENKP